MSLSGGVGVPNHTLHLIEDSAPLKCEDIYNILRTYVSRQHARPFYFIFAKDYSIVACHEEHTVDREALGRKIHKTAYARDARRHTQTICTGRLA